MIRIQKLETEQRKDALDRKGTSIDKISIEQVRILLGWQTVDLENVEEVVKLTVNIATNGEFLIVWNRDIDQSWLGPEVGFDVT